MEGADSTIFPCCRLFNNGSALTLTSVPRPPAQSFEDFFPLVGGLGVALTPQKLILQRFSELASGTNAKVVQFQLGVVVFVNISSKLMS